MTTAQLRITAVVLVTAVGMFAVSAPGLAAGSTNSGSTSKKEGGGRTLADYNIQKE
ncbi:MAG: hypothetical protein NTV73_11150 [Hyphomicrobiales bacterium]|nr:hypothetical protein [Hyphomicrobiales bacterium]